MSLINNYFSKKENKEYLLILCIYEQEIKSTVVIFSEKNAD